MSRKNARRIAKIEQTTQASRKGVPAELTTSERGIRLQKAMAEAGFASRRDCEEAIEQGRVTVNGKPVTALPAWVDPMEDTITVDGAALAKPRKAQTSKELRGQTIGATPHDKIVIVFNKPPRVIATTSDPEGRTCVADLIQATFPQRLFLAGRLDFESTGLLLLTNDGELAQHLTHPSQGIAKEYLISVRGRVEEMDLDKVRKGMYISEAPEIKRVRGEAVVKNAPLNPSEFTGEVVMKKALIENIKILRRETSRPRGSSQQLAQTKAKAQDTTLLSITLHENQKMDVRRVMAKLGFQVRSLQRVAVGPIHLKGVAVGSWRALTAIEVRKLRVAAGV